MKPRVETWKKLITGRLAMDPCSYAPDLAERVAFFVYNNAADLDGIIISGDVATTGLSEDLRVAHEFVAAPSDTWLDARGRPTLSGANSWIFVLPGNHDRYEDCGGDAGCNRFNDVFSNFWGSQHPYVNHKVIEKGGAYLAILGADFCLRRNSDADSPQNMYKYGQGRVYTDVIEELKKRTEHLRCRFCDIVPIWVVHFLPVYGCDETLKLIDHSLFLEQALAHGIQLILAGHTHESKIYYSKDGLTVACAGSASVFERDGRNSIHILELSLNKNEIERAYRTDFVWDGEEFVEKDTRALL
jgi:predicted phosphodiesterase